MIEYTYNRFMIPRAEGRRMTMVESDDDYVDDKNPLFVWIDGASRCVIPLHVTSTNNSRKICMGQRLNT